MLDSIFFFRRPILSCQSGFLTLAWWHGLLDLTRNIRTWGPERSGGWAARCAAEIPVISQWLNPEEQPVEGRGRPGQFFTGSCSRGASWRWAGWAEHPPQLRVSLMSFLALCLTLAGCCTMRMGCPAPALIFLVTSAWLWIHPCIAHPSCSPPVFMVCLHISFVFLPSFLSDLAVAADFSETVRVQYKCLCYWRPERGGKGTWPVIKWLWQ